MIRGKKNPKKNNILAHEINISVSINKISLELRNTHLFRRCRQLFSHYNGRLVMENSLKFLLFDPSQKLAPKDTTRLPPVDDAQTHGALNTPSASTDCRPSLSAVLAVESWWENEVNFSLFVSLGTQDLPQMGLKFQHLRMLKKFF